jgi:hypothetical protein
MHLKWGTVGEGEKGMGRKGGGEVSLQPTRDQSGRESHHDTKEGFQVSMRGGQGTGVGISQQRWVIERIGVCTSNTTQILYIQCQSCICRANKGLCLGYK